MPTGQKGSERRGQPAAQGDGEVRPGALGPLLITLSLGVPAEPALQYSMAPKDCTHKDQSTGVRESISPWKHFRGGAVIWAALGWGQGSGHKACPLVLLVLGLFFLRPITCSSPTLLCRTEALTGVRR